MNLPTCVTYELVYDDEAAPVIKERWPGAVLADASDYSHEGRFEVWVPGCDEADFYAFMILEGFAGCCLGFEMSLLMAEKRDDVRRWIAAAETLKAAS